MKRFFVIILCVLLLSVGCVSDNDRYIINSELPMNNVRCDHLDCHMSLDIPYDWLYEVKETDEVITILDTLMLSSEAEVCNEE